MDIRQELYERVYSLVAEINHTHGHDFHVFFNYMHKIDSAFIASINKEYDPINGWQPEREFVIDFAGDDRDGLINECIKYLESIK